ncbi:cell division protein FtsA [Peribacillus simplex]|uniref:Cell division protein FtsA n=2 Tax=Peribacillus TaxID=2675229 RepID=A0A9X8ZLE2_9BACI|nr:MULTISPECIES: cell division protein FtsA [Peribacillus]MDP1417877.1 cell division protein FtsA [Peribacillus simplex]MDP1450657.1 cell division protein FtsA [Peribacillus frigoritolerans]TKH04001.1 cell division protein FtsA [Peribacillus simplex]TKH16269.1 cell division protein FtsA [Peribacillus simplex]
MNSNEIYVSLDIGTSSVKVIIGEMVNDTLNIIGVGNVKSEGLKKGSIVGIDETVQSIQKAIEQAERMIGMEIKKVIVGISGNHVTLQPCHGVVAVSSDNKEITEHDVFRVREAAELITIPSDREIIDVVPIHYKVDELDEISDPRGMIGVRLEMRGILITGLRTILHNTLRCVERAGLEITDIALQPLAAGSLVLSKDEKELGVALVDIGGGSTTLAIFEQGYLQYTSVIPIGGETLTKDLSIVLRTTMEEAEKIKVKHGHAFYDDASEDEVFQIPIIGSDQQQTCNQLMLSDIIEARVTEIFELIQDDLRRLGFQDIPGGFVLTGGVVKMPGVLELAQYVFQNRVRTAEPNYIGVREPQYTTAVGLIKHACKKERMQKNTANKTPVAAGQAQEDNDQRSQKVSQKNKENTAKKQGEKGESKFKKILGYFFE